MAVAPHRNQFVEAYEIAREHRTKFWFGVVLIGALVVVVGQFGTRIYDLAGNSLVVAPSLLSALIEFVVVIGVAVIGSYVVAWFQVPRRRLEARLDGLQTLLVDQGNRLVALNALVGNQATAIAELQQRPRDTHITVDVGETLGQALLANPLTAQTVLQAGLTQVTPTPTPIPTPNPPVPPPVVVAPAQTSIAPVHPSSTSASAATPGPVDPASGTSPAPGSGS